MVNANERVLKNMGITHKQIKKTFSLALYNSSTAVLCMTPFVIIRSYIYTSFHDRICLMRRVLAYL